MLFESRSVDLGSMLGEMRNLFISVMVLATASTACSSETSAADSEAETTASTFESETTLADLQRVLNLTVSLPRMSFEMDVTSSLPGSDKPVVARQTGSFDDNTLSGIGTRQFESEDSTISELLGVEAFEFRFIDRTVWIYNPLEDPPTWNGFDAFEFAEFSGAGPSNSMDSDSFLTLLVAATSEVVDVVAEDDGTNKWTLRVRADALLPIVATGGPASRMAQAGAGDSGLEAEIALTPICRRPLPLPLAAS